MHGCDQAPAAPASAATAGALGLVILHNPPTHPLPLSAFSGFAATSRLPHSDGSVNASVVVLSALSSTLVDAATTPKALSTVALLASLSQWEWPSPNWLDAILSMY
eukprot:363620-Chlamydomonas_euryale.AAC.11